MRKVSRIIARRLFAAGLCACLTALPSAAQVLVRSVKVLGNKDTVEIEVEASDRIVPQTQVLTGPDRLVIDFPNAVPSNQVRSQSVDRAEVKDVRVSLFQAKPPVTRVVLDLKTAQSYQVFPDGRTVMIKVLGGAGASDPSANARAPQPSAHAGLVVANYTASAEPVRVQGPPQPSLEVSYRDGLLGIRARKVTLSEVLFAVAQRTGADISVAAGAEQEMVVAEIEPAPAAEVLARLLNGSRFNFLILSSPNNPRQLDRVILSTRNETSMPLPPLSAPPGRNDDAVEEEPAIVAAPPNDAAPAPAQGPQGPPRTEPEMRKPVDENNPD